MNSILKISASLALTAGMIFTVNNFPHDPSNKVLLDIDGSRMTYLTKQDTVGAFLEERGLVLGAEDQISLPVTERIDGEETLVINKAVPVTVTVAGRETKINTLYKDVRSLLSSLGITLTGEDRMNVALTDALTPDMAITIQRIVVEDTTRILPVAHGTVTKDSASLLKGKETVGTAGADGEREVTTRNTWIDGKLVSSEVIADFLAKAPVAEVILEGTKAPVVAKKATPKVITVKAPEKKTTTVKRTTSTTTAKASTSTASSQNWRSFTLTFYTNLPSENGGYTVTATGKTLRFGMVASNYYSLGKQIYLQGYGTMTVEDRGGSNFNSSSRLDVFIPRKSGESNSAYLSRVNNMGIRTVKGYLK